MVNRSSGKPRSTPRTAWEVVGYDSATEIFRTEVPTGLITLKRLNELLRILAAKHGCLNDEEIVDSLVRRGTRRHRGLLEVRRCKDDERRTTTYTCGENPHFVAALRELP